MGVRAGTNPRVSGGFGSMSRFSRSFVLAAAGAIALHWATPAQSPSRRRRSRRAALRSGDTCQMCHGADLRQLPNAMLAAPEFGARWTGRNTTDLLIQLRATMPPEAPGSLPETTYLGIIAYLLQTNGFTANNAALTAATSAVIGSDALATTRPAAEPIGVTVAGTVRDFVPLTEQALESPAAGDWPMLRRDYGASSYSPLKDITAANAHRLQLAWIWPMRDGGTNEPSPLAYRGTVLPQQHAGHRASHRRPRRHVDLGASLEGQPSRCAAWRCTTTSCSCRPTAT